MIKCLILVCIFVLLAFYFIRLKREANNVKKFFINTSKIEISNLVLFSIKELVKRMKKYRENQGKKFLVEYADGKYLELDSNDTKENLVRKLEDMQDFMIEKRYNKDDGYVVKDCIESIMFDIWLDYAHNKNYEDAFWRQMYKKLNAGDVSESTFNAVYKNFYKFKYTFSDFKL